MPAPLAKGLIIAASVIVAAGIAIYESPHVRQWVDQSRRKLAVALHTLGDEIQPRRNSEPSQDPEARKRRREDLIRRNRNELIRRAREEGIAVDLDELTRIGKDEDLTKESTTRAGAHEKSQSFDDLIGTDGKLKDERSTAQKTTALDSDDGLRRRGQGLGGFLGGSVAANPFADDDSQIMFDRDLAGPDPDEAPSPNPFNYIESRDSTATLEGVPYPQTTGQLIDLTPDSIQEEADLLQAINNSLESSIQENTSEHASQGQSFHSFCSAASADSVDQDMHGSSTVPAEEKYDPEPEHLSTGTLTPRSDGFSTNASVVGSHADDIAILSMQNDDDHDARSEAFSEGGFSEFAEGERIGVMTPNSWTDVGSDDESDFGGTGLQGTQQWGQSTIQQNQ